MFLTVVFFLVAVLNNFQKNHGSREKKQQQ